MKRVRQSLKEIERRWLRPLFACMKWRRRPVPAFQAWSTGTEQLLVAMLRAEIRRRARGEKTSVLLAVRHDGRAGANDLEQLARTMLTLPSEVRRAAG